MRSKEWSSHKAAFACCRWPVRASLLAIFFLLLLGNQVCTYKSYTYITFHSIRNFRDRARLAAPKHALGEFEGSLAKALECPIATREFFVAIVVCSSSIGADDTNEIERMALYDVLLPSLGRTIETDKYRYELFVGIDDGDEAYMDAENQHKLHHLAAEYNLSMQIHAFPSVEDRIPWNDILLVAREAGADYFVRLNDDTELASKDWTSLGIATLASYDPPNVGVVGPVESTYQEDIGKVCINVSCGLDLLQHDMVHARHMEIFDDMYYPPRFPNVMVDDWMSHVYGTERTTKLIDWVVNHRRNKQGTRYKPTPFTHIEFFEEVAEGSLKVNKWLENVGETLVVRGEYDDLLGVENTEHTFSIVILTMNRPDSLCRLLSSLEATDFAGDNVRLVIKIDHSENSVGVGHLAQSFAFSHGNVRVEFSTQNKGLRQSWLDAWTYHPESYSNHSMDSSLGIILEDDVELSPFWYIWLKEGWNAYVDRTDIAGISLQRQTLVPQQPAKHIHMEPFLFKLVGSMGFSPHPQRWKEFLEWVAAKDLEHFDASVDGLITSEWYATQDKRSMWTQLFIRFCDEHSPPLYTLYVNLPNGETLGGHWREKGEHLKEGLGLDFALATNAETPWLEFPENVARYG